MFLGGLNGLGGDLGGGFGQGGVNTTGVKPANSLISEQVIPIDVARFQLGCGGQSSVRHTDGTADSKSPFGEVKSVPNFLPSPSYGIH